jgi:FAD/FMN-containing dehydrogenase
MNRLLHAGALLIGIATLAACPMWLHGEDVTIKVRLVNGKNGKPITDENLNIWFNDATGSRLFRPDPDGVIKLQVASSDVLSFASNIQVTCHPYGKTERSLRKYQASEILEHGIADQNLCSSKLHVQASPGEFVFFERPRTFWEWMRL